MRIRHVVRGRCNPDNADGIIRHTYYLAHAQRSLGHDVEVYGVASRAEAPEIIDRDGLVVRAFPATTIPFGVHPGLREQIQSFDRSPDTIFHLQPPHEPAVYGLGRLLHRLGIPYMLAAHAMWDPHALARHRVKKAAYKVAFDNRLTRDSVGVHATASAEVADIARYAPGVRAFAVRNSLDLEGIDAIPGDPRFWETRFGIPPEARVFVFLGRLDPYQKGLDLLLEGWRRAVPDGGGAVLALVGPPWGEGADLPTEVARLGLEGSVLMTGPLYGSDKHRALCAADCYVQTSRYETSPYSIQEAMAARLPAVVTPATNFGDVVERYRAGRRVELDAASIGSALSDMLTLPAADLQQMGEQARRLVEERHSLARAATRIVEAYRAAISGGPFVDDD
jgi:glycosyltransferase involved in cell wall biosynthesis